MLYSLLCLAGTRSSSLFNNAAASLRKCFRRTETGRRFRAVLTRIAEFNYIACFWTFGDFLPRFCLPYFRFTIPSLLFSAHSIQRKTSPLSPHLPYFSLGNYISPRRILYFIDESMSTPVRGDGDRNIQIVNPSIGRK